MVRRASQHADGSTGGTEEKRRGESVEQAIHGHHSPGKRKQRGMAFRRDGGRGSRCRGSGGGCPGGARWLASSKHGMAAVSDALTPASALLARARAPWAGAWRAIVMLGLWLFTHLQCNAGHGRCSRRTHHAQAQRHTHPATAHRGRRAWETAVEGAGDAPRASPKPQSGAMAVAAVTPGGEADGYAEREGEGEGEGGRHGTKKQKAGTKPKAHMGYCLC